MQQGAERLKDYCKVIPNRDTTDLMRQRETPASKLVDEDHKAALTDLKQQQQSRLESQRELKQRLAMLQESIGSILAHIGEP